jgi:ribosomal protein L17
VAASTSVCHNAFSCSQMKIRKLNKTASHKWAMLRYSQASTVVHPGPSLTAVVDRNMVTSLIHHERIKTTVPKAKELRRVAEKMVMLAKRGPGAFRPMHFTRTRA